MNVGLEWSRAEAAALLRRPTPADDKYSRGVVGLRTGSERYPGAAVLGVEGAWRAGAGMVRYTGPAAGAVLARRPETVVGPGRVQAWVIGSGTDAGARTAADLDELCAILAGETPVVVDAGALDLARGASAPIVVTPHDGEHRRLRDELGLGVEPDRIAAAAETARALGATVLLKGAVTVVADHRGRVRIVTAPTSWLSTAGTGDVLAGVLGALLAAGTGSSGAPGAATGSDAGVGAAAATSGGADLLGVAATAAWVHGHAGSAASGRRGGGPLVALEVAEAVASVIGDLLAARAD